MSQATTTIMTLAEYERAAREYCRQLPLEHFMESESQSTQKKITLESLDLVHARRPEVQVFSELLIQYFHEGNLRQVVPDNMVRLCEEPLRTGSSFNLELEAAPPLWVLEYVSRSNRRKDYEESFQKYEHELRVPYCLLFDADRQDLRLYHHTGEEYELVRPNRAGRYAISELDLELGLLDRWVRYWYRRRLLDLPSDLLRHLGQEKRRADREKRRADKAEAEVTRLRALLRQKRGERDGIKRRPPKR